MDPSDLSRRRFVSLASVAAVSTVIGDEANACGLLHRRRPCPPTPTPTTSASIRRNINALDSQQLASLSKGVAAMKALPADDPRSWSFQANIHGTNGPATSPLFSQCEHGTLLFLPWHRGYLYFFERILRWASGDQSLTLPYWDWTTQPTLPMAYRSPASPTNPLYEPSRHINDGSALPVQVVDTDLGTALNYVPFPPSGFPGFSPSLEDRPHGVIHGLVGGLMAHVPTAANDPIFWLHHGNIDRIWDRWLNQGGGRVNPSDSSYLNTPYSFADEHGATKTVTVREIMSSAALGYRYDNVPNPPAARTMTVQMAQAIDGAKMLRAASSAPEEEPERKPLEFKSRTEKLTIAEPHLMAMKAAAEGTRVGKGKILVQIEGIEVAEVPTYTYAVYLNVADDEADPRKLKAHYLGSLNFFGKVDHDHGDNDQAFDATAVIARLKKTGQWKDEAISVTLRPLTVVPPRGKETELKERAEASASRAEIKYKRINLLVLP